MFSGVRKFRNFMVLLSGLKTKLNEYGDGHVMICLYFENLSIKSS